MLKFLRIPFATSGDKAAIGFPVDAGGAVSYSEGYPFDYQRASTDPAVKNIERDKMNGLFFDITTALKELQSQGIPDFITSALNGGTAYSYAANAVVTYSGDLYLSLAGSNTALPSDTTKWALLPTPARIQTEAYSSDATVGGTANALTAELTPTVTALAGQAFRIRAAFANTAANPTLNLDGTGALTIVKCNNLPLVAGDIPGAGAWLDIKHDVALGRFVLLNPANSQEGTRISLYAEVSTASGLRATFASIPTWAKKLTLNINGVGSTGSTLARLRVRIGSGGGMQTTGYAGCSLVTRNAAATSGANLATAGIEFSVMTGSAIRCGSLVLTKVGGNVWAFNGCIADATSPNICTVAGVHTTLTGALDTLDVAMGDGSSEQFNAGSVSLLVEG